MNVRRHGHRSWRSLVAEWAVHLDAPQYLSYAQRHWLETAEVPVSSIRVRRPDGQHPTARLRGALFAGYLADDAYSFTGSPDSVRKGNIFVSAATCSNTCHSALSLLICAVSHIRPPAVREVSTNPDCLVDAEAEFDPDRLQGRGR